MLLLLGLLTLVSYVDRVYQEVGKFLSREFQDNIDVFEQKVEPELGVGRSRASLSMAVLTQLTMAADRVADWLSGFQRPVLEHLRDSASLVQPDSHRHSLQPLSAVRVLLADQGRVVGALDAHSESSDLPGDAGHDRAGFSAVGRFTDQARHTSEQPETSAEAVDALIEAGQEEGIIQEGDRDLIQSVVEFSGKTVREAMKPRPQMFAVPSDTTVERFIEMLRAKHYSRVPVYEGSIHNIKGIVYTQDVLQVPDSEAHVRTLDTIMRRDVYFVPESKLGSDLAARDAEAEHPHGDCGRRVRRRRRPGHHRRSGGRDCRARSATTTTSRRSCAKASARSSLPGGMDVDRLDELFGTKPEGKESATIAGLVSELAGRIPRKGEVVEEDGLRFEVLESTDRKVERVRVTAVQPRQLKLI